MPDVMLPATFAALLAEFRCVFTRPSFDNFVVLVAGFVHALGGHRITDALRAAGSSASKQYNAYYRFFSRGRWSIDTLGLVLLELMIRLFKLDTVELVLDDTLTRRTGKNVALATMHADPLLKKTSRGRLFASYGHVFVVLSVHVRMPGLAKTGWALPFLFRLFEGSMQGGRADAPSDKRRRRDRRRTNKPQRSRARMTDREVVDGKLQRCEARVDTGPLPKDIRPKKTELAAELLLLVARRFPHTQFRVVADHLYNGRSVLHAVVNTVDNVHVISRGRPDAALYEMAPPRRAGQMGRPRVRGERLPSPQQHAAEAVFREVTVEMYGRDVRVLVASCLGMAYRSLPGRMLRYVIVKDPDGIYRTDYFLCTDTTLSEVEILTAYARRWPLERTFQDCKQQLRVANTQTQAPASVRRSVPFGMITYSLVVMWFLTDGHKHTAAATPDDPWYKRTSRPSFRDMLAALRRMGWAEPFLDPPSRDPARQQKLADYLARVAAAA